MEELEKIRQEVIYTQVRVKTDQAGGSGTIVYSKENNKKTFSNYVLTCQHVIDAAITIKKDWAPPPIGRDIKKEYRKIVTVEFFDYENVPYGHRPLNYSADADIMCYDKTNDMALLKLRTLKKANNVCNILPMEKEESIKIGSDILACGCALLHDPILTAGQITHMGDEIDYKDYWMSNASTIFGNSGGAIYIQMDGIYYFIGIPSRIDIVGWGTPVTHLGYFSPVHRIYKFLEEQMFNFIVDPIYTEEKCETLREMKRKNEEKKMTIGEETEPASAKDTPLEKI